MEIFVLHSNVHFARIIFIGIIFSAFVQTHQDEVKLWNNKPNLYPTNSVYQNNNRQSALLSKTNVVTVPLKNVNDNSDEISESHRQDEEESEEEIVYEDDYKINDSHENVKNIPVAIIPENTTHYEKNVEENSKDEDSYYYYDDEYDNVTNSRTLEGVEYDSSSSSEAVSKETSPSLSPSPLTKIANIENESEDDRLIGEQVVSVVTTKSVVNGTISVPSYLPSTTEQIISPIEFLNSTSTEPSILPSSEPPLPSSSETTEDSIIVASVQTSRSISGARFLPFNLNGDTPDPEKNKTDKNKSPNLESTESIIDKLDRVQSELSGGFLAGGFRTGGNALQLDVLNEQRLTTSKPITTTGKTPVISKFIPRRYNDRRTIIATTEAEVTSTTSRTADENTIDNSDETTANKNTTSSSSTNTTTNNSTNNINNNKGGFRWPSLSRRPTTTAKTTKRPTSQSKDVPQNISVSLPPTNRLKNNDDKSLISDIIARSKINLSSLLPDNYKLKETTTVKSLTDSSKFSIQNLIGKSAVDISAFLPPDYNKKSKIIADNSTTIVITTTTASSPIQKTLQELFSKSSIDISSLLPAGYDKEEKKNETIELEKSKILPMEVDTAVSSTTKSPGVKLVFPSRPGGRKAVQQKPTIQQSRFTTTLKTIQKGWPTRLTTEFTGWPTPSTTPISIQKLLEAAQTATANQMNSSMSPITSEILTTSSTTTSTTTTIRPTTPGICNDECEIAGTIRIIGNAVWVPELLDRNTHEWQQLANEIKKEMHLVFIKSAILRKWYKNVRIDAFSPGSILVDYFVELKDLSQRINTQEIRVLFHDSLRTYNAHRWNETRIKGPTRLGEFIIDPKSTDFVVIPKLNIPQQVEKDNRLIPQWAIAIIVISVGGLLIVVFAVSVIVKFDNRENKKKYASKNIIQASQVTMSNRSSNDYPKSEISSSDNDPWREKSFESQSHKVLMDAMLPDERKYNVYDSWRSEWRNSYYYQPSHTSSKFAGYETTPQYSRQPPDYDTNF